VNAKENALEVIRFGDPEWVPGAAPVHAIHYLGCHHRSYDGTGGHDVPLGTRWTDIWGIVWHKEHEGVMGFPRGHPLADLPRAIRRYRWPDPDDERLCSRVYQMAESWDAGETFLSGQHRDTLWEKSYMLVGMENLMCYLHTEPTAVRELFHRIMDFQLGMATHYLAVGVEMVGLGDDLGTQQGPLIPPEMVEDFLVPEYRRLFGLYRSRGVLIRFHSCGNIMRFLPMFMELGVDILDPIQASANDLDELRTVTQGRMALAGGVNSSVVYDGPSERIRTLVAERLWQLGRQGGYFCQQDQGLPYPEVHREALQSAVEELGRYPLRPPV